MSRYRKTLAALVGAILVTVPLVWDGSVTQDEAMALIVAWATAFGVYGVPNDRPAGEPLDPHISERDVPA